MFIIPREYDSIKASLRKKNPKWSDKKLSASAAKIFFSIYNITVKEAIKLENSGKWEAYKKKISKKELGINELFSYSSKGIELKEIEGEYYIDAIISTPDLDLVNDIVSPNAQKQMVDQILSSSIKAGVFHDRKSIPIGKAVDAKVLDGYKTWVRTKLNKSIKYSNPGFWKTFLKSIEEGFIDSISIEYQAKKYYNKLIGNTVARVIDGINLLGYTFTGRPANPNAKINGGFFVKSFDVLEDINNKNLEVKTIMTEEDEKPAVEETKVKEIEVKQEPVEQKEQKEQKVSEEKQPIAELKELVKKYEAKLAEYEKKERDIAKVAELKEKGIIEDRLAKLEKQSKVLQVQEKEIAESKIIDSELAELKENPTWEKAKELANKLNLF